MTFYKFSKRIAFAYALLIGLVALLLGACSTASQTTFTDNVIALTKAGCHLTVNISANVAAVNPGSGFQAQGSADCPGAVTSVPAGARLGVTEGGERAAPVASFLK